MPPFLAEPENADMDATRARQPAARITTHAAEGFCRTFPIRCHGGHRIGDCSRSVAVTSARKRSDTQSHFDAKTPRRGIFLRLRPLAEFGSLKQPGSGGDSCPQGGTFAQLGALPDSPLSEVHLLFASGFTIENRFSFGIDLVSNKVTVGAPARPSPWRSGASLVALTQRCVMLTAEQLRPRRVGQPFARVWKGAWTRSKGALVKFGGVAPCKSAPRSEPERLVMFGLTSQADGAAPGHAAEAIGLTERCS